MNFSQIGAGVFDCKVKTASGDEYDVFAISSVSSDPEQDEVEIKGDDETKGTFVSNIRESMTLVANGLNFETLEAITGNTLASSTGGMELPIGTVTQASPVNLEVQAYVRAKDSDNVSTTVSKVWHNVQFTSLSLSMETESEMSIEMTGTAYQTESDITGSALGSKRIATLQVIYSA
jgi:hypothetical protein